MTKYEYYKEQYKRTAYPLIDEKQFDELVAEIRAESAEKIKELEETISKMEITRENIGPDSCEYEIPNRCPLLKKK